AEADLAVVVIGVTEFMGQGADIAEVAGEVQHHARFSARVDRRAEGAVALALTWWDIDPTLIEGPLREGRHVFGVGSESLDHERLRLFPTELRRAGLR